MNPGDGFDESGESGIGATVAMIERAPRDSNKEVRPYISFPPTTLSWAESQAERTTVSGTLSALEVVEIEGPVG